MLPKVEWRQVRFIEGLVAVAAWLLLTHLFPVPLRVRVVGAVFAFIVGDWLARSLRSMGVIGASGKPTKPVLSAGEKNGRLVGAVLGGGSGLFYLSAWYFYYGDVSSVSEILLQGFMVLLLVIIGAWIGMTAARFATQTIGRVEMPRLTDTFWFRTPWLVSLLTVLGALFGFTAAIFNLPPIERIRPINLASAFLWALAIGYLGSWFGQLMLQSRSRLSDAYKRMQASPRWRWLMGGVLAALLGLALQFPFSSSEEENIATVRLAAFIAVLFFGVAGWLIARAIYKMSNKTAGGLLGYAVSGAVIGMILFILLTSNTESGNPLLVGGSIGAAAGMVLRYLQPNVIARALLGGLLTILVAGKNLDTFAGLLPAPVWVAIGIAVSILVFVWVEAERTQQLS